MSEPENKKAPAGRAVALQYGSSAAPVVVASGMNIPAKFELYEKVGDSGNWELHTTTTQPDGVIAEINSTDGTMYGASYTRNFVTGNTSSSTNAELLKNMNVPRYYGIRFTSINNVGGEDGRKTWSGKVEMQVQAIAGSSLSALHNLAVSSMQDSDVTEAVGDGLVQVGSPTGYTMSGSTWYTFLTVGKSTADSGDAFCAIRPVYNTDSTPPMVTACLSDIQPTAPGSTVYKGTVTLVFSEDLYWVVKDLSTSNQTVTPLEATANMSSTGFYSAGLAFHRSLAFDIVPGTAKQKISSVTFIFTNATQGAYIHGAPGRLSGRQRREAEPPVPSHPRTDGRDPLPRNHYLKKELLPMITTSLDSAPKYTVICGILQISMQYGYTGTLIKIKRLTTGIQTGSEAFFHGKRQLPQPTVKAGLLTKDGKHSYLIFCFNLNASLPSSRFLVRACRSARGP